MPYRKILFANGEFYHVFNRGVARMPIFNNKRDYNRFLKTFVYYQILGPKPKFSLFKPEAHKLETDKKIVEVICYCLMPNHFHFLLKQNSDGGITEFLSKISNSYTKYFNTKNGRPGPLFQGEFKAVHIETNEQLLHLSRYIHLNPLLGYLTDNLETYPWSSFPEYLGKENTYISSKKIILEQFKTNKDYKQFILDQEDYGKELEKIKHQLLDPHVQA